VSHSVLIAEDEKNILEALSFILSREGYVVASALDGNTAIEHIRGNQTDLLILDVMLPYKNGFEVLKTVKTDPDLSKVPVIMLTAKGQSQDRKTAEDMGVDAFVTKPFSNKEIIETVKRLLSSKPA